MLALRGGQVFTLSSGAYVWAVLAGVCIGCAEIGYLYLFGGVGLTKPMAASLAVPTIVSGTIVIAMAFSYLALKEPMAWHHLFGGLLIVVGIVVLSAKGFTSG